MPAELKKFVMRLALIVPTLLVFSLIELGYRAYLHFEDRSQAHQARQPNVIEKRDPDEPLKLRDIVKWNENPRILYDLIPSISGSFIDSTLTINADGFRGNAVSVDRDKQNLRIAGIGDSVMFGWGVDDNETYLEKLPDALAKAGCERRVETINSAVPGYNAVMAVETLEKKILAYQPDIVIYHYVLNDLNLPSFINQKNPIWTATHSFVLRTIKRRLRNKFATDYRLGHPPENIRDRDYLGEEEKIPDEFKDLLGLPAFSRAMQRLHNLRKSDGLHPIVLSHFPIPQKIISALGNVDAAVINSYPQAQRYLKTHQQEKYLGSSLTVSATDRHPSAKYHALIAQVVAEYLINTDFCRT